MKRVLLINYDNGSRWPVLPQNLIALAASLAHEPGVRVQILDFNLLKEPYSSIADRLGDVDVVGLGFIAGYWPHREALKISRVIKELYPKFNFKFIIGGHGPSAAPAYYLKALGADAAFAGSADMSLKNWIRDGCRRGGIIPSEGLDPTLDMYSRYPQSRHLDVYKRIRFPNTRTDEFAIQLLSGRGCPYACSFCFRTDRTFSHYSISQIIIQMETLYNVHGITHFQFSDELFMSSSTFINKMCKAITMLQDTLSDEIGFDCNGRLNQATPEILATMKRAGCRYINYGCEALDNDVLARMNKKQTVDDIVTGIEATLAAGISPGLNFMWGNPGDSEHTLDRALVFILTYTDYCELRTIRPVTPYPGTPLFKMLIEEGRLPKSTAVSTFYKEHKNSDLFTFHWLEGMTNEDADKYLMIANETIVEDYHKVKLRSMVNGALDFYTHKSDPLEFRGWREI